MKRISIHRFVAIAVFVLICNSNLALATSPPKKGGVLPEINLPAPGNPLHKSYLGLSGEGLFQIPQIKAKAVIIQIFSMY
ncbi:MAG: hypothetical protein JRJ17_04375 [Deltaproteobacteria bacterium]|nr:hypothetical protein [Deltaproteobacteria bacterium]